jgi:hypothetical protein
MSTRTTTLNAPRAQPTLQRAFLRVGNGLWLIETNEPQEFGQKTVRQTSKLHAPYFLRYGLAKFTKGVCPLGGQVNV